MAEHTPREWSTAAQNTPEQIRRMRNLLREMESIASAGGDLDADLVGDLEQQLDTLSPSMARRLLTVTVGAMQVFVRAVAAEHALLDLQIVRDVYASRREAQAATRSARDHEDRAEAHASRAEVAAITALDAALRPVRVEDRAVERAVRATSYDVRRLQDQIDRLEGLVVAITIGAVVAVGLALLALVVAVA